MKRYVQILSALAVAVGTLTIVLCGLAAVGSASAASSTTAETEVFVGSAIAGLVVALLGGCAWLFVGSVKS